MALVVQTPPLVEPLSLAEAKAHLRVTIDDDDAIIQNLIRTARWNLERKYRRACMTQTLTLGLDFFGQADFQWDIWWPVGWWPPQGYGLPITTAIELRPPLQSVTAITYTDPSGTVQTLPSANYLVDTMSEPGRVAPALGKTWPATAAVPNAVQIQFVAGYTDPRLIPDDIRSALKLIIGDLYENREQSLIGTRLVVVELPRGVDDLMAPYRPYLVR